MFKKIFVGVALVVSFNMVPLSALADHSTAHTIQQLQDQINALLIQIQNLQQQTSESPAQPEETAKFSLNDSVVTTAALQARSSPSTSGGSVAVIRSGIRGTVIGGPIFNNSYVWWHVNWPIGRGWSAENWLEKTTVTTVTTGTRPTQPAPAPTPAPTPVPEPITSSPAQTENVEYSLVQLSSAERILPIGTTANKTLYKFTASNSGEQDNVIGSFSFNISKSGTTIKNLALYAYTDPAFSVADTSISPTGLVASVSISSDVSSTITLSCTAVPCSHNNGYVVSSGSSRYFKLTALTENLSNNGTISLSFYPSGTNSNLAVGSTLSTETLTSQTTTTASLQIPKISKILYPPGTGALWKAGEQNVVNWSSENFPQDVSYGEQSQLVNITLYNLSTLQSINLASNIPNTGTALVNVPSTVLAGNYQLIIDCFGYRRDCISGESERFSIVSASPSISPQPTPTPTRITGVSFTFSHNNLQLIAGRDTWTLNTYGLQGGDEVWIDAWKDSAPLGKFKICTVPTASSPVPSVSCLGTGTPTDADKGGWEEAVIVRRGGVDTVVAPRGAIKFSVVIPIQSTATPPSPAIFTFSANSQTLTAGQNSWTFNLQGGRVGDKLMVVASKDNVPLNNGQLLDVCTVMFSASCTKTATPTTADIGQWSEIVYINGIEKGRVLFNVVAPTTITTTSFSFSHNGAQLIAGRDTWTLNTSGLQGGDEVWIDAWKDSAPLGKFKICTVPTASSPVPSVSCLGTGTPTDADKGGWEEAVILKRGTTETVIAPRGAIKFSVIVPVQPLVIFSSPLTSFTFSANNQTLIAGQNPWTFNVQNGNAGDKLTVVAKKDNVLLNNGSPLDICTVISAPSCTKTATPTTADIGQWSEIVYINGIEKGQVSFSVVAPTTVTTTTSQPVSSTSQIACSLYFSKTNITVGDNVSWTVSSFPSTGFSAYWYGKKNNDPSTELNGSFAGTTNFTQSYQYQSGDIGTYTRFLVLRNSSGINVCTTNTLNVTVNAVTSQNTVKENNNFATVIYSMMETLNSISKQLDLLK